MKTKEIISLRGHCLSLLSEHTGKDKEMINIVSDITAKHLLLPIPSSKLVTDTYKGIIGYKNWLEEHDRPFSSFLSDALHDLGGALKYQRNDGFSPRTSAFIMFYKPRNT